MSEVEEVYAVPKIERLIGVEDSYTRAHWAFDFKISELGAAVGRKIAHHQSRLDHWKEKFEEAKRSAPDAIIIEDDAADALATGKLSYSNIAGGPRVRVDADLQNKLQEAFRKVDEHQRKIFEFERWKRLLARESPDTIVPLKVADVEFFGL